MADGKEILGNPDLTNMAAAALGADHMHRELSHPIKGKLTPEDVLGVAKVVIGQAEKWPEGDPRITIWREVADRLGTALIRPQGEQ
ncbi:MAG TPA: hypothetical protein VFB59_05810 [Candidatus Saccharimonadales bacterium]|nr:hypothetical protein [Candidatus Saccharimonadales bacterium]